MYSLRYRLGLRVLDVLIPLSHVPGPFGRAVFRLELRLLGHLGSLLARGAS